MTEPVTVLVSPTESGTYTSFDSDGAAKIVLRSDATQLANAMRLLAFERGTLLEITVREAGQT